MLLRRAAEDEGNGAARDGSGKGDEETVMGWLSNDTFGPCSSFQLALNDRLLLAEDGLEATGRCLGCATELPVRAGSWIVVTGGSARGSSLSSVEPDERLFMGGEGSLESSSGGSSRSIEPLGYVWEGKEEKMGAGAIVG